MKIMPDTNIFISALLFPKSAPSKILYYVSQKHDMVLCDYIIDEIKRVTAKKYPELLKNIDWLLSKLVYETVSAPLVSNDFISDPKDQPILAAAFAADVDIIISGDKHFLSLKLDRPQTMSISQFNEFELLK